MSSCCCLILRPFFVSPTHYLFIDLSKCIFYLSVFCLFDCFALCQFLRSYGQFVLVQLLLPTAGTELSVSATLLLTHSAFKKLVKMHTNALKKSKVVKIEQFKFYLRKKISLSKLWRSYEQFFLVSVYRKICINPLMHGQF